MSKFTLLFAIVVASIVGAPSSHAITSNVRSITIANNQNDWFYIEELTAIVNGVDRASLFAGASETQNFAPAFGSSVVGAIDDALTGCCGTGVHSDAPDINKSVTVTFNKQFNLDQIKLHGRIDGCCPERLNNVIVSYFDGPNGTGNLIASHNVIGAGAVNPVTGLTVITPDAAGVVDTGPYKVALTNPTSLKAQTGFGGLTPDKAIDTITNVQGGWGNGNPGGDFGPNIAVFETLENVGGTGGSELTFSLNFSSFADHALGKFRLSATTDDRSQFADGLFQGGDVTANWFTLKPTSAASTSGNPLNILPDDSILVTSLFDPATDVFTIKVKTPITGITGFRLEALQDPSLPVNGPGLSNSNGNFVLTEFTVTALDVTIPEPTTFGLATLGAFALLRRRRVA
jgi:hypothetical protein